MFVLITNTLCIGNLFAQTYANNASQFLQRLSPNEGLSQSQVNQTIQDAQGFIWVATEMGLNRYDGYDVQIIAGPNAAFATETIIQLFIDKQNFLWVSTETSGLYKINTQTLEVKQQLTPHAFAEANTVEVNTVEANTLGANPDDSQWSEDVYSYVINAIEQGENNTLWLGVFDRIYQYNTATAQLTLQAKLPLPGNIINDLYLDKHWLFCATSKGLLRLNTQNNHVELIPHQVRDYPTDDSNNIKVLIKDKQLGLLAGTAEGLFMINHLNDNSIAEIDLVKLIPTVNIWDMITFKNDFLIASDQGLFLLNRRDLSLSPMLKFSQSLYQISDDTILNLFLDNNANLWLASKTQGVLRWSTKTLRFTNINATSALSLSDDVVFSIYQDDEEMLWVGTANGLNLIDLNNNTLQSYFTLTHEYSSTDPQVIYNIYPFYQDNTKLWLVTEKGLQLFDKTTKKIISAGFSQAMLNILASEPTYFYHIIDNELILFVSAKSHYLYNIKTGEVEEVTALNKLSPSVDNLGYLPSLLNEKYEVLVVSSGYLSKFNVITGRSSIIYKTKNFRVNNMAYVDSWALDENNTLWLAVSGEGLIGLDGKTFKEKHRFDITNILPSDKIYSLQLDSFNHLWFSSQVGLFRLNLANYHLEHFESEEGVLAVEYNSHAYGRLKNNALIFGSTRGITFFEPKEFITSNKITPQQNSSSVTLTGLSLLSNENRQFPVLQSLDKIVLAHDEYGLSFKFSTLDFTSQSKVIYDIKLEGPSDLHYKNYKKNELLISKLTPGEYKLIISAIDTVSGNKSVPMIIFIESVASPWLTLHAKLLYILLIVLLIWREIDKRNKSRDALLFAHNQTKVSEERMMLALKSNRSGVWDYDIVKDELYDLREAEELGYPLSKPPYTAAQHFSKVAHKDLKLNEHRWSEFIHGKLEHWEITYQMRTKTGEWLWFRDVGRVVSKDRHGNPERVSGTYTNITQAKADEARAVLFGEAFSQINDWVLIVDDKLETVTANQAFLTALSHKIVDRTKDNSSEQDIDNLPDFEDFINAFGEQKVEEFTQVIEKIKPGESWQGEEVLHNTGGIYKPVLIKINAIVNFNQHITHYVIVISDITIQKTAEEKLRHLAHYDYLTNLPNRKLILEKIEQSIVDHKRTQEKSALFFIDLDKFKQVNDSLGHAVGDELLAYVANTLVQNVKAKDLVARQSGDEFMILIDSFDEIEHLSHLAQRILTFLSMPLKLNGSHVNVSASIGIAIYPDDAEDSAQLIQKADLAMIHAKETGRSRFEFFTKEINDKAQERIKLETELQRAFKKDEFINYYQPIVDCAQHKIIGFELLIRWPHKGGMISPELFIPIAEDVGLIGKMTEAAIERSLKDLRQWQTRYPEAYVSINLSALHILQEGLTQTLKSLVYKYDVNPKLIRLEITEGTLLSDQAIALKRLEELKNLGFKLLLDDFGTGYSSLTYLSKFPIDIIKIDQSFIRHLQSNSSNKPIIQSIVALANNLDISCIAEGVETEKQLSYMRSLDCDVIQGYYFAMPAAIDDILTDKYKMSVYNLLH